MSKIKTTTLLTLGCILAGTALWCLNQPELLPYVRSEKRSTLLNIKLNEINEISIWGNNSTKLKFKYTGTGWQMTEPNTYPANPTSIARLLDVFEKAPIVDLISGTDCEIRAISKSDLGFDHPFGGAVLSGPRHYNAEISIGNYTAMSNGVFTMIVNSSSPNDVYVTTPEIAGIVNEPEVNFIDRRLFRNDPRRVNTIILNQGNAGTIKLVRDKSAGWLIKQPIQARADWAVVNKLFGVLFDAEIQDIVHVNPDGTSRYSKSETGLGENTEIRMQMFGQDIPAGVSLAIGNTLNDGSDTTFARSGNDSSVLLTTGAVARAAAITLYDLRDKRIFTSKCGTEMNSLSIERGGQVLSFKKNENGSWALTGPIAAVASPEIIAKLISSVLSLTATRIADTPQTLESGPKEELEKEDTGSAPISISFTEKGQNYSLKITEQQDDDSITTQKVYHAVLNKESTIYELRDNQDVEMILECLTMPHMTIDKKILDVNEKALARIEITRTDGSTEIIERSGGEWKSTDPSKNISLPDLSQFFKALHPLVADSVVSANHTSMMTPQMESQNAVSPQTTILFIFSDGVSLQKTLFLGPALPAPNNGFYARVKSHNAVYAISQEKMSFLTQPFVSKIIPDSELPSAVPPAPAESRTSTNE